MVNFLGTVPDWLVAIGTISATSTALFLADRERRERRRSLIEPAWVRLDVDRAENDVDTWRAVVTLRTGAHEVLDCEALVKYFHSGRWHTRSIQMGMSGWIAKNYEHDVTFTVKSADSANIRGMVRLKDLRGREWHYDLRKHGFVRKRVFERWRAEQ